MLSFPSSRELAQQLSTDVVPKLDAAGVKLVFISIGTAERGRMFAEETGLDVNLIYADPDNVTYDALGFYKGFARTFLNAATPLSINQRLLKDGAKDLKGIMPRWKPWIPPKLEQGLQQGNGPAP